MDKSNTIADKTFMALYDDVFIPKKDILKEGGNDETYLYLFVLP